MDTKIIPYEKKYKQKVFDFTDTCFEKLGKKFDPLGRHEFYNNIEHSFEAFYCLLSEEKVVGTVALKNINEETAELKALYLSQELRGQGFGFQLINKVICKAKKLGYKVILLDSLSQYKEALKLYEKVGFEKIDRYNDNPYADVFMKKIL